ncbi:MAG: type II toxin-antitoxin system prevent-host-death family antitoxin [Gallionella sp.]|nr:type II toxin-antitoxin system prevent-host-death family antitoxin [Gallionella sp.]
MIFRSLCVTSEFNISQAKSRFSELVDKTLLGEEIVISRDNKPLLKLVPVGRSIRRMPGSAKGDILYMADDFDAPLGDFADYV